MGASVNSVTNSSNFHNYFLYKEIVIFTEKKKPKNNEDIFKKIWLKRDEGLGSI